MPECSPLSVASACKHPTEPAAYRSPRTPGDCGQRHAVEEASVLVLPNPRKGVADGAQHLRSESPNESLDKANAAKAARALLK